MFDDLRFVSPDNVFELRAAALIIHRPFLGKPRVLMATNTTTDYAYSVGGAVIFGETTREAARREAQEETGWPVAIGALAAIEETCFTEGGRTMHIVCFHYWAEMTEAFTPSGESTVLDGGPETLRWFSAPDLDKITFYPVFYKDALANHWPGIVHSFERDGRTIIERDTGTAGS